MLKRERKRLLLIKYLMFLANQNISSVFYMQPDNPSSAHGFISIEWVTGYRGCLTILQ